MSVILKPRKINPSPLRLGAKPRSGADLAALATGAAAVLALVLSSAIPTRAQVTASPAVGVVSASLSADR